MVITDDDKLKDAPLSCPREMSDNFRDLVEIEAESIEQDMVPVYSGDLARCRLSLESEEILTPKQLEKHYEMTVNGSACFLFQIGSVERRKNPQQKLL